MKILTFILSLSLFITGTIISQIKFNISLANPTIESGYFAMEVRVTVKTAQVWKVGGSNIRVDWTSTPANGYSVHPDNPVSGANTNISYPGNSNYAGMTTTSITGGGAAISFNIARLGACYYLAPGNYMLGRIRFNRLDSNASITLVIRTTSMIQDSITPLAYGTDWTKTDPPAFIIVGASQISSSLPKEFKLYNNYPNPFNPSTTIKFDLVRSSNVVITIYDILGKEIEYLVSSKLDAGTYEVKWDGAKYSSGVYFYKIETESFSDIKKMLLVK
jgi:hypothetical protein